MEINPVQQTSEHVLEVPKLASRRYVTQSSHFPNFYDYVIDNYVIGHKIIGFSASPNARSRPDQWVPEVRFIRYSVLHNFWVTVLSPVFMEFVSVRLFLKLFRKISKKFCISWIRGQKFLAAKLPLSPISIK